MFCYGACVCVLASRTSEQVLLPPSQRCLDGGRWERKNSWSWKSETFFNGKICLFKMYGDLFFNLWMSIFSHVLIVTSGALPVPYGLTVRNGCLVIAASAVVALCTALLHFYTCFFTFFFLLGGGDSCIFLLILNISVLGKTMALIWQGTWNPVPVSSHSYPNFACIIRAGDWESLIVFSELCPGAAVRIPSYSLAPLCKQNQNSLKFGSKIDGSTVCPSHGVWVSPVSNSSLDGLCGRPGAR